MTGAEPPKVQRVLVNGDVVTLDPDKPAPEAIAIGAGRILRSGTRTEVDVLVDADTELVDLGGRTVIPALVDHHLHLTAIGNAVLNQRGGGRLFLQLAGAPSTAAIVERVAARAEQVPRGEWILGMGWNQHDWGTGDLPDNRELSRRVQDHPVLLVRTDAHSAWVNDAALRAAGIGPDTPSPPGGAILSAEGRPTGMLLERAVEPVLAKIPESPGWEIREAFRAAVETLAAQGVTIVYDAGFMASPALVSMGVDFELYLELLEWVEAEHGLPIDVNLMVPAPSSFADKLTANPEVWRDPAPSLRVSHIKLFADGAFGSRGAALSHPYRDDPAGEGLLRMTPGQIEAETRRAIAAGFDVATHAIGDRAVAVVLDAYERVASEDPGIDRGRFRIEHFGYASEGDIRRGAESGFVLVAQPNFILPDTGGITMEDRRLGADACRRVYPWRTLIEHGAAVAGSSDYYVAPGPPLLDFYVAHTRKSPDGDPADGWQPQERLSREQALKLVTTHRGPGGSLSGGILTEGARADLAVVSGNPLEVGESEILDIAVHATLRRGEFTHRDMSLC